MRSWSYLRDYADIYLKDLRETTNTSVIIAGFLAEILTQTSQIRSMSAYHSSTKIGGNLSWNGFKIV